MMYANNFAAAILVRGKVLREFGDAVYLPFGSEYSIRLKNLGSSRAKVSIDIDGSGVTDGGLVLDPFQTTDLERFIRNGNLKEGNRFKFIERSAKIEDHRGITVDDGLISIRYEFELVSTIFDSHSYKTYKSEKDDYRIVDPAIICSQNFSRSVSNLSIQASCNSAPPVNETGITVEGSLSNQSFSTTYWKGSIGGVNVMNIRLLGETEDNAPVRQAVTVKTKAKCKTCGTLNKATAKFCSECGTSLQIVS